MLGCRNGTVLSRALVLNDICLGRTCAPPLPGGEPRYCFQLDADRCQRHVVRKAFHVHACVVSAGQQACVLGPRCRGDAAPPPPRPPPQTLADECIAPAMHGSKLAHPLACDSYGGSAAARDNYRYTADDQVYLAEICHAWRINGTACFKPHQSAPSVAVACAPNFVGIGFEKSGSTKIAELLDAHADVLFSSGKEAGGWMPSSSAGKLPYPGAHAYVNELYNWTSRRLRPPIAVGEFSHYAQLWTCDRYDIEGVDLWNEEAMLRIEMLALPDTRFIVAMRNPADRAWSHFNYHERASVGQTRGYTSLPQGAGFAVATCHAFALLGGDSFVHATMVRMLGKLASFDGSTTSRLDPLAASRPEHRPRLRPWCTTYNAANTSARTFPHWDLLTPGLYYDNLAPWVSRFGRHRFAFVDMAWIGTHRAMQDILACLGLPALSFDESQLQEPSINTMQADAARRYSEKPLRALADFYAPSNHLTFKLTGVGLDWSTRPALNSSAGLAVAEIRAMCRRCVVDPDSGMTTSC